MPRTLSEPQIAPAEALAVFVHGLKDFARSTFGVSLPPDEAHALRQARGRAQLMAEAIEAGAFTGPVLLEIRGYYLAAGRPGVNDVNIFDDACILLSVSRGRAVASTRIRGNVDPSSLRDGMAVKVAPQLYTVAEGRHRDRRGLRQRSPILIDRVGKGGVEYRVSPDRWPYTNMHEDKGAGTGSAGCSTYPADEWAILYAQAKALGDVPVVLVDEVARRAWTP